MTVYVESNFLLEVALAQEQSGSAQHLLAYAEAGGLNLCFPAFCVAEPLSTLHRRAVDRRELATKLTAESAQLLRSSSLHGELTEISRAADLLRATEQVESVQLRNSLSRLVNCAVLLELSGPVFEEAQDLTTGVGLDLPDAIVLASVLRHLRTEPSQPRLFVNRNDRDFDQALVRQQLKELGCDYIGGFDSALARVNAHLKGPQDATEAKNRRALCLSCNA